MILELFKFGAIFFLPSLIGKIYKIYQNLKKKEFSMFSWKKQSLSCNILNALVLVYVIVKFGSTFFFGSENFFYKVDARIDSPSYIIRNNYRTYVEQWAINNADINEIKSLTENEAESNKFQGSSIYKSFLDMQTLSEQLKIKEKKAAYSKYGERAFLNCQYCSADTDYLMFLAPYAIFEYSIFLIVLGVLSSSSLKTNWRLYGLIVAFVTLLFEIYAFIFPSQSLSGLELYDVAFGDDMFTLKYEKIVFIREALLSLFLLIALIFDNSKDLRLKTILDQIRNSLETSLAFLQATRIQSAAISVDENLQKYVHDSTSTNKSKLSSIISDPVFRQKVAESGHKLNIEELMEQRNKKIDDLFVLMQNK